MKILLRGWLAPGLNEYSRMHWSKQRKCVDLASMQILAALGRDRSSAVFKGPVHVEYVRYTTQPMDWDNSAASFKSVGDALVKIGVIEDDGPHIITRWTHLQYRVPHEDHQGTVIEISPGSARDLSMALSPFATVRR